MSITVFCNKCGKKMDMTNMRPTLSYVRELDEDLGFDGNCLCIDLCANCLSELIDSCAIDPISFDYELNSRRVYEY